MYEVLGLTYLGFEKVASNEIKKMGYKISGANNGMIFTSVDEVGLYKLNMNARSIERFLLVIKRFKVDNFDDLYNEVYNINWGDYILKNNGVAIDKLTSKNSKLFALKAIQSVVQKAIYEKLMDVYHTSKIKEESKIKLRVYIRNDEVIIGLDLSGEALHKRGYRKLIGKAPLKETIAAGLILMSGWRRKYSLHDPFCGSGTIPIEAALYAYNIPPCLNRNFDIFKLKIFNNVVYKNAKDSLESKINNDVVINITGTDYSKDILDVARINLSYHKFADKIDFHYSDFKDIKLKENNGYVITNPPYGERMIDVSRAEEIYKDMSFFTDKNDTWKLNVITTNSNFEKCYGQKAKKVRKFQNGKLSSYYYMY